MGEVIAWATFAGAWLLVAGPLYQGSAELAELDFDREGIQGAAAAVQTAQARPSAWSWLLPPAMYVLHRRWYRALRQAMLPQLSQIQREQVTRFQSKSTGWFTVAAGATLLAMGDTWQIIQHYRWPVWAFWLLLAVMLVAAVLTTTVLMIGDARMRRAGTAGIAGTAPAAERRLLVVLPEGAEGRAHARTLLAQDSDLLRLQRRDKQGQQRRPARPPVP
jgi:hypothetical protein